MHAKVEGLKSIIHWHDFRVNLAERAKYFLIGLTSESREKYQDHIITFPG